MVTTCLTCGCNSPLDRHGDNANIDLGRLQKAADAAGITVLRAAANIRDTLPVPGPLPRLHVDIDGTLAFQPEASIVAVNARFGTSHIIPEATSYPWVATLPADQRKWQRAQQAILGANLPPDTLAIDVLRRAVLHGYPVTVCTERDPSLAAITRAWTAYWQVPCDQVAVTGPGGKEELLAACGPDDPAILVDDSPANELLARDGVQVWVPRRPWTPQDDPPPGVWRFGSWNETVTRLGLT